jgi:hypothetical protein
MRPRAKRQSGDEAAGDASCPGAFGQYFLTSKSSSANAKFAESQSSSQCDRVSVKTAAQPDKQVGRGQRVLGPILS